MLAIPPDHRLTAEPPVASPGVLALLAATARRRGDGALALCTAIGVVAAVAAAALLPRWPLGVLPAVAVAAFGGWGIVDRIATDRRDDGQAGDGVAAGALRIAGWAVAVTGLLAVVGFALVATAELLGGGWF